MQISSIAGGGLSAAETQLDHAASAVVHSAAPATPATPATPAAPAAVERPDRLDLSVLAANLVAAKENYSANLAALRAADSMSKQTLNLLG
jgi:hypothetical protein